MTHISGSFEVKLTQQTAPEEIASANLGRMTINKRFTGELEAHSLGEMLATGTAIQGSAGYVALERVTGSLQGRQGSFALMHFGTMNRGEASLQLKVVPDSGTAALTGLSGEMTIDIRNGQHFYGFDFSLPE